MAASTQNQALVALLFLYKETLGPTIPWLDGMARAKRPVPLPVVLTQEEVCALLSQLTASKWLMVSVLYGAGLRLRECLQLRVKDINFSYRQVVVRHGKGGKDRVMMLPEAPCSRSRHISVACTTCTGVISRKDTAKLGCPTRSALSTPEPVMSGAGVP